MTENNELTQSCDEPAMLVLAAQVAGNLLPGDLLYLQGDLGAGKTTFTRGVLRALGHRGAVKSPTYTLVEPYDLDAFTVNHFDLYRLSDPEELDYIGIRDYLGPTQVCLIEWPERGQGMLPSPDLCITLTVSGERRLVNMAAHSMRGRELLAGCQHSSG